MNIDRIATSIEKTFFDYLAKSINDAELCKRLSDILSSADINGVRRTYTVDIIDGKSEFLGMCVYPDMGEYSSVILDLYGSDLRYEQFCRSWFTSINHYYIELDKNLFDRTIINFTPQELTAMLLHELSHVAFSDKTTEKLYKAYVVHKNHINKHERGLTKVALSTLYVVPGMIACTAHKANTGKNGMREEYICDKVFGLRGYQEHLVSALDKIVKAYGTKFVLDDGTSDKKLEASMRWVDFNIDNIVSRRDALGREIVNMSSATRSKYAKDSFLTITRRLGIGARDRYTGKLIAMESVLDEIYNGDLLYNEVLTKYDFVDDIKAVSALEMAVKCGNAKEAMESLIRKKPKMPNGYDIDSIMIEIDRVRTHTDRLYVLDLIYAKRSQIEEFVEFYGEDSPEVEKYRPKIDAYNKQLDEMTARLLNKHSLEKTYKVFVKCPEGYEG